MSFRFSLLGLIGLTTFAGLASAALVQPGFGWASVITSATCAMFCWQVLRAMFTTGQSRAAAVGWLVFAVGYLALILGPWLSSHLGPHLLTSRGLVYAQVEWHKAPLNPSNAQAQQWIDWNGQINSPPYFGSVGTLVPDGGLVSYAASTAAVDQAVVAHHFQLSGHWLFAWIAGWLGALVAVQLQRFQATRRAAV